MNLLFTICARAGSKGVKNKNIRVFINNPLVYYTLSAIDLFIKSNQKKYQSIDIAINTDSKELIELVDKTKLSYQYIDRKSELATDSSSKIDVIRDTFLECQNINNKTYSYIIDLDLTSPLRCLHDLENLLNKIETNKDADVVFSVTGARRNPYFNMVQKVEGSFKKVIQSKFTARQQAPVIYDMNASMYAYTSIFLTKDRKQIFDGNIEVIEMLDTAVLDIDNEEDLELMQVIAPYFYKKYDEYRQVKENISNLL
jgi:CMP-N,N'-diacetyllegionaminic acid synthase